MLHRRPDDVDCWGFMVGMFALQQMLGTNSELLKRWIYAILTVCVSICWWDWMRFRKNIAAVHQRLNHDGREGFNNDGSALE